MRILPLLVLLVASDATAQTRLLVTATDLEERQRIPGAQIRVTRLEDGRVVATVTTDSRGAVVIRVPSSRAYRVQATLEGYISYETAMIYAAPGDVAVPLLFSTLEPVWQIEEPGPQPEKGLIGGVVSTLEGAPLANLQVEAKSTDGAWTEHATTRANGSYRMALPPGTYIVGVGGPELLPPPRFRNAAKYTTHARRESAPVAVTSHGGVRVDLQLPAGPQLFNVRATVVDDAGRPVPGATIKLFGRRGEPIKGSFTGSSVTGAKGFAMLGPMTPGPVLIVAMAARDQAELAGTTSVEIVDALLDVTVRVQPGATFSGRVEFVNRATPLHGTGGLRLIFDPPGFASSWSSADPGLMNPDGTFVVRGLVGQRCLRVREVPAGWRLKDVTHEGRDLTNRLVRFEPYDAYTDVVIRIERGEPADPQPDCEP